MPDGGRALGNVFHPRLRRPPKAKAPQKKGTAHEARPEFREETPNQGTASASGWAVPQHD